MCSRTFSIGSAFGLGRNQTESTIPWTTSYPWDSAISIVWTRMSRAYALIASWHSIRPKRAFLYPWYPKLVTRVHLRIVSRPVHILERSRFFLHLLVIPSSL